MFFRSLIYLFIIISSLDASITIDVNTSRISLLPYSTMYLDTSSKETFEEVRLKKFKATNAEEIKLGYTHSAVWIKLEIKNKSDQYLDRYLTVDKPILDTVELFEKKGSKYSKRTKGLLYLDQYEYHNIIYPSFDLKFKPLESKSLYLKIHTTGASNNFKLDLKDTQTLYKDEFAYQIIKTTFLGVILGLIIYNLFLFFFIKEYVYLYYVLYMFFLTLYYLTYTQIMNYIILITQAYYVIYLIGLTNIFALLFIKTFLKVKNKIHIYFYMQSSLHI